ncbi:MAG: hypothetical protein ABSG41_11705 [Bryobacteraceae bacterium]|jgi:hypothetical protein
MRRYLGLSARLSKNSWCSCWNNFETSLVASKKYTGSLNVWQGRVTLGWRFYFVIEGDEYVILSIIPHLK